MQKKKRSQLVRGWKILFRYFFSYRREVLWFSILGVLSALAGGSIPLLVGRFLDALVAEENYVEIFTYSAPLWLVLLMVWLVAQVIVNASDYARNRIRIAVGNKMHGEYLARAASHLLFLPVSFHKDHRTGETWDKFNRASNSLVRIVENVVIQFAPEFLEIIVGIALAFYISPPLALILVVAVLLYIASLAKVVGPVAAYQKEGNEAWNEAYGDAYDALANYQAVKQATAELHETVNIHKKFVEKAANLWARVERVWTTIGSLQRVLIVLTQLAIFGTAVYLVRTGGLTIGELIALNSYAGLVFGPFVRLGYNWQVIQNGIIAIERAEEILNLKREGEGGGKKKRVSHLRGEVEFEHVFFRYKEDERWVLHDVNFKVDAGEVAALVGESGVGKSTVIDLISAYYFPTKGRVLHDGTSSVEVELQSLRQHIAVVPQEPVLFNDTVRANIAYGKFDASFEEIREAACKARAEEFIEKFPHGYEQLVGERGIKLSVGQKQRIAIARAILRDPAILILDEPTSALDVVTEKYIQQSLHELMKGRTTFIIAHRLSTVRNADKILVFDGGRIVESGRHEELIGKTGGVYQRLYKLHMGFV